MENAETDCRSVLEHLYQYLDGELEAISCADIDRHLAMCAECLQHVGFEREVLQIIGQKCRESQTPAGLADQIRRRLHDLL